jgi:hypothetical protein
MIISLMFILFYYIIFMFFFRGILEYVLSTSGGGGHFIVRSTGNQRSSRLLSLRHANALIVLVRICNTLNILNSFFVTVTIIIIIIYEYDKYMISSI